MEKLSFKLEVFEGPLDALLYLISKNKLNIYDIAISELLDQYMDYLHTMQDMDLEVTSNFLEMASRLVQIKTAMLLPRYEDEPEDDPRSELMATLIEYKTCQALAQTLRAREQGFNRMTREPIKLEHSPEYRLRHDPQELREAILSSAARLKRRLPPPASAFSGVVGRPIVSVASRVVHILRELVRAGTRPVESLFLSARARSEAVATFLALLELIRSHKIGLVDTSSGEYVKIQKRNER